MKLRTAVITWAIVASLVAPSASGLLATEKPKLFIPDKALCAKMLRFGKEAYMRRRYLDAKEYFRKAIQADPTSQTAWLYYDQAVILGLAERVEKDAGLLLPGKSQRLEQPSGGPTTIPPPPPAPQTKKESGFKIVEDEGC